MVRTLLLASVLALVVGSSFTLAQDPPPAAEDQAPQNPLTRALSIMTQRITNLEAKLKDLEQEKVDTEVVTRVIRLEHAEAMGVLTVLVQVYDETIDKVKIAAAPEANSLVLRGGKAMLDEMQEVVALLDSKPAN